MTTAVDSQHIIMFSMHVTVFSLRSDANEIQYQKKKKNNSDPLYMITGECRDV